MGWCEAAEADFLFGLGRNSRLQKIVGKQMHEAKQVHAETGKAARIFTEFQYKTKKSWARERRVVAKAEYLDKGENPRFVVTSLGAGEWAARALYEQFYCQRGEMENRIKEQMCLFAYRLSSEEMKGNRLRLYLPALAYSLLPGAYKRPPRVAGAQLHLSPEADLREGLRRPALLKVSRPDSTTVFHICCPSAGRSYASNLTSTCDETGRAAANLAYASSRTESPLIPRLARSSAHNNRIRVRNAD